MRILFRDFLLQNAKLLIPTNDKAHNSHLDLFRTPQFASASHLFNLARLEHYSQLGHQYCISNSS